jgi:hypothetical protein
MAATSQVATDVVKATTVVEQMSDVLVRRAAQTLCDSLYGDKPGISENQLSNLVNVAVSARSLYEIIAFVMYQIGRVSEWSEKSKVGTCSFGEAILRELSGKEHQTAVARLRSSASRGQALEDLVVLFGVRKYAGYLRQLHKFLQKAELEERWEYVRKLAEQGSH